ncbi:CHAD domain-containing protein [Aerolutibacter ruishenii]|uniref:CHAD domain-containing protein n=1 Tax=Aerolutibacter ruishenii TaxID=686800 RepID=A0A562LKS7_9GAMM|nr:CHAD domain-containing protein [Lysobacter ruishenii]TWI08211.1 CHAD domain-containing protein [Lysobacter ruishenii]
MEDLSADAAGPGSALRAYGVAELALARESLGLRGRQAHEGIHQARKSIRRVRAMLALCGKTLGPGGGLVDRQLRRLNRQLSPLRDAHALVETLDRLGLKPRNAQAREALATARKIAARRCAALARQADFVRALGEAEAVVAMLQAALHGLPWADVTVPALVDAMDAAARKAKRMRQHALAHDDAEDWHRWRRSMRRLSQQQRAAGAAGLPLQPDEFDKHLTEQLGVMQDLSLLIAHCGDGSPFPRATRVVLRHFAERSLARQRKRIRSVMPCS